MGSQPKQDYLNNLRYDIPASVVVFLVSMPLCLGIALTSGAPLFSGIIAGMIGGMLIGIISSSSLGISGPAAGLAVIVLSAIQELQTFEVFLYVVVVAGVFQIILGLLKAGVIGYYFPNSVIKGMLSGIGIIIILKQIPHAFGYDKDPEGDYAFFQVDGHTTFSELTYMLEYISPGALTITLISMAILILWEQPFMQKIGAFSLIRGPLVAVITGIFLHLLFRDWDNFALNSDQLVNIPVAESAAAFLGQFTFPDFSQWNNPDVYILALTLAIVASLETLVSVEAIDKLDPYRRVTPTNQELLAQGTGNIISGLIGGLPISQVIVRSSVNIQSGARTKLSAFMYGLLLLISAMAIPRVLNLIPLSSLAAILLVVGYKLARPSLFKEMYSKGQNQFVPFIVTVLGIIFTNLLIGITLGLVVAIFQILWNNYKVPYHFKSEDFDDNQQINIQLSEDVSFLNKVSILHTFNRLPNNSQVIIDASKTKNIHPDVLEIIEDFQENAKTRGITVQLIGFQKDLLEDPVNHLEQAVMVKPDKKRKRK
ncbi:MAG: SulP family inorganic anion transporter [Bacteroidetes bacterium]|nr:SulP family inorganic anion transporter [Bacteroidota bacterium]